MKKEYLKGFSVVFFSLLVIFVGMVLLGYLSSLRDTSKEVTLFYRVLLPSVDGALFGVDGLIPEGASVRNENGTVELGRVVSVSVMPRDERGERYDLELEVQCRAQRTNVMGIRVNDVRIAAGLSYTMRFDGFVYQNALVIFVIEEEV